MIIVNPAAALHYGANVDVPPFLVHAKWIGLTPADWVFPAFVMMVGVSIPFALGRREPDADLYRRIGWRTLRLVLLGLFLSNLHWLRDLPVDEWRLFGVLQRIGLVYGSCCLLYLPLGWRARGALLVAVLVLYWPLLLLPVGGASSDLFVSGMNAAAFVDRMLFAPHLYVKGPAGFDPEGLLSTLPAIAHGLIGVAIGEVIVARGKRAATRALLLIGSGMIGAGFCWSLVFPIIKALWTGSFVLVTCGITTIVLAGLSAWLDQGRPHVKAARSFVAIGTGFGINAIAAYALHMVTAGLPTWDMLLLPYEAARALLAEPLAALLPILSYLLLIGFFIDGLRRKGWVIKI
ncbi:acyltransferase family protein [Croceicoccus hydrothermalis]|uniref:acyltransferase family protein n=1 Tax=Croceicoccus hydrothermalis TaxID=2867964 RepID=UPI001EFAD0C9|nr:hypothetical protein [Croceicoccus hydrothermalis]